MKSLKAKKGSTTAVLSSQSSNKEKETDILAQAEVKNPLDGISAAPKTGASPGGLETQKQAKESREQTKTPSIKSQH